jgi:hypothetical protein
MDSFLRVYKEGFLGFTDRAACPTHLLFSVVVINILWREEFLVLSFASDWQSCFYPRMSKNSLSAFFSCLIFRLINQSLHPYKRTGKIAVFFVLVCARFWTFVIPPLHIMWHAQEVTFVSKPAGGINNLLIKQMRLSARFVKGALKRCA